MLSRVKFSQFLTLLVVSTYRTCHRAAYRISTGHLPCETNITSPPQPSVTWGTGGSSTIPTTVPATSSCTLQFWTPAALLPPAPWENRDNWEKDSFLHLMQPASPRLVCEKGFFAALGASAGVRIRWFSVLREGLVGLSIPRQVPQQRPPMAQPVLLPPGCARTS